MKRSKTDFVPIYGYSPSNVRIICIRETLPRKRRHNGSNPTQALAEDGGITLFCDFHTTQGKFARAYYSEHLKVLNNADLFDFQQKMLSEEIYLDIERVRYMELSHGSRKHKLDAPRIQLWRECRNDTPVFDDNMSHHTAGTMLSGPRKDCTTLRNSRLVIYMGRSEEYRSMFSECYDAKNKTALGYGYVLTSA